jgi:septum formation inhibitor-activating ATPase MinD
MDIIMGTMQKIQDLVDKMTNSLSSKVELVKILDIQNQTLPGISQDKSRSFIQNESISLMNKKLVESQKTK